MAEQDDRPLLVPVGTLNLRPIARASFPLPPVRVLVVDADKEVAQTLARTIERLPETEVVVAHSVPDALDMIREANFDAALVDLGLDARGVDLLLAIRMASPETIRVLLSAWPDESIAVGGAVFTGAQAWFQKPWNTGSLLSTVQGLLKPKSVRVAEGAHLN
jgi:ActR/RegA family two-component response regulator